VQEEERQEAVPNMYVGEGSMMAAMFVKQEVEEEVKAHHVKKLVAPPVPQVE